MEYSTRSMSGNGDASPGGGSAAGVPVTRAFSFSFDTPGILTGAALYTPTVGDILLDAWIEINTAWNGTTPSGDIGWPPFSSTQSGTGLYAYSFTYAVDMTLAAQTGLSESGIGPVTVLNSFAGLKEYDAVGAAFDSLRVPAIPSGGSSEQEFARISNFFFNSAPVLPLKFNATDSLCMCVSQTGGTDGADPGSTQGAAILYLVTSTPA